MELKYCCPVLRVQLAKIHMRGFIYFHMKSFLPIFTTFSQLFPLFLNSSYEALIYILLLIVTTAILPAPEYPRGERELYCGFEMVLPVCVHSPDPQGHSYLQGNIRRPSCP